MKKIFHGLRRGKYTGIMVCASLVLLAVLLIPHTAMAADTVNPEIDKMYREISNMLQLVLNILQRIMWPVLLLIGGLMNNNILFGAGMEQRVLAIWVEIRNLVNVMFVLLLLGIALYNVVGGSNQSFQLKQALPKFVIALIAVNFSYLAVKLVVDGVNVVSTAIFALPVTIDAEGIGKNPIDNPDFVEQICYGIYGGKDSAALYEKRIDEAGEGALCKKSPVEFKDDSVKNFFTQFDAQNAAMIMALELQQIGSIDVVKYNVPDIKDLISNMMFSVIMFIIYSTAFVVLFVVLLVRLVTLWVTMVLSPLMVLTYALPENLKSMVGGKGDMQTKFVKAAIVPIPIAIVLTIGYIMMKGVIIGKFEGPVLGTSPASQGVLASGLNTFQYLIAAVGTAAVVWIGVFEAASGTYAQGAVDKIRGFVGGVGKFAAESIKYAPLFPVYVPGEKGGLEKGAPQSLASMMGGFEAMKMARESRERQKGEDFAKLITGRDMPKFQSELEAAKNAEQTLQPLVNAGADNAARDKLMMKTFGQKLENQEIRGKFRLKPVVDGKEVDISTFAKQLREGKYDEKAAADFITRNANDQKVSYKAPPKEEEKTEGGKPAPSHDRAAAVAGAAAGYDAALKPEEKAALDKYRADMGGKDRKTADDDLADPQLKSAIDKMEELQNSKRQFVNKASAAKNGNELNAEIDKRMEELKNEGIDEETQKKIIAKELKDMKSSKKEIYESSKANSWEAAEDKSVPTTALGGTAAPAAPAGGKGGAVDKNAPKSPPTDAELKKSGSITRPGYIWNRNLNTWQKTN